VRGRLRVRVRPAHGFPGLGRPCFCQTTFRATERIFCPIRKTKFLTGCLRAPGVLASNPLSKDLKIHSFSLAFHGKRLIEDTLLELSYGNRYGLLGSNGSGKSTFLTVSLQLLMPPVLLLLLLLLLPLPLPLPPSPPLSAAAWMIVRA
jgi:hypothetical protein